MLRQFGSERPAAEKATGKGVLEASCGDEAFALCVSKGTPGVLASASRHCFTA